MAAKELENPERFLEGYRELSAGRQRKIDQIRPGQEKRLSLAAGLLLDRGLRGYGLREREILTRTGAHGKPYFPDAPEIHFNLSHSGDLAFAVFSDTEVGCDIQQMGRLNSKLAERFYCPGELSWMMADERKIGQKIRFYRLWALKESFIKATGLGLQLPLTAFCFKMEPAVLVCQHSDDAEYEFEEYSFGGYRAAVCMRSVHQKAEYA